MYTDKELEAFDLTRAVLSMAQGTLYRSLEGELLRAASERAGKPFNANNLVVPWSLLAKRTTGTVGADDAGWAAFQRIKRGQLMRRDLTEAAEPEIIPSPMLSALDVLRGFASTIEAGATVLQGKGTLSLPEVTAEADFYWLSDENAPITRSQPTLAALTATPHLVGSLVGYSHLLKAASAQGEAVVGNHLRRLVGKAVDQAALVGTGADGQPEGLLTNSNIASVSISGDLAAAIRSALKTVELAGAKPTGWIVGANQAETLRATAKISNGAPIMERNAIDGLPVAISDSAPNALVCGNFADLNIVMFGDGLELAIDPYSRDWERGLLQMRCLASCDIVTRRAASFCKLI